MAQGDKVQQLRLIDYETGEIEVDVTTIKRRDNLGKDWVAMYQKAMKTIIKEVPTLGTMKILLFIASSINFEGRLQATKAYIAKEVGLSYQEAHKCLKWLEANNYIQCVANETGNYDFYVNPDITMKGNKKTHAVKGWVSRMNDKVEITQRNGRVVYTFHD